MSAKRTVTCLRSASMQPSGWLQGPRIAYLSGRQRMPLDPVAAAKLEPSQARRCLSLALRESSGRFEREADINRLTGSAGSVANDPKPTFDVLHSRGRLPS